MADILGPDGQPAPKQVRIEREQGTVMLRMMVEAQISAVMAAFKMPPHQMAQVLGHTIAALLAPINPPEARAAVTEEFIKALRHEINITAGNLAMQAMAINNVVKM